MGIIEKLKKPIIGGTLLVLVFYVGFSESVDQRKFMVSFFKYVNKMFKTVIIVEIQFF